MGRLYDGVRLMSYPKLRDPGEVGEEMLAAERGWPRYTDVEGTPFQPALYWAKDSKEVGGTS